MLIAKRRAVSRRRRTGSRIDKYPVNWLSGQPVILWTAGQLGGTAAGQLSSQPDDHADAFVRGRGGHGSLPAS